MVGVAGVDYGSMAVSSMNSLSAGMLYVFILILVAGVAWGIMILLQYNIRVRLKEITGGKKIIHDTKAKYDKKKQCIHIWKFKDKAPLPPDAAYETNPKGKKCLECYRINGQYIYATDEMTAEKIAFKPLTTGDREFYLHEMRLAEERKGFNWEQHIPALAGFAVLIIIFVIAIVFWGDIMKPAIQAQQTSAGIIADVKVVTANQAAIMEDMRQIMNNEQIIRDAPPDAVGG